MIGVRHRSFGGGVNEFLAVGPFAAGMVLRGVWCLASSGTAILINVGASVCGSGEESLANAAGGVQLVESDGAGFAGTGVKALSFNVFGGGMFWFRLPVYYAVVSGPVWVIVSAGSSAVWQLTVGAEVEVERSVAPYPFGSGTRAGRRGVGGVLGALKDAAAASRT